MENPPLRLLLGSDAVAVAEKLKKVRAESDDQLRELSESTDHHEWTPAHLAALKDMLASVSPAD
jgi:hypothetical protein